MTACVRISNWAAKLGVIKNKSCECSTDPK